MTCMVSEVKNFQSRCVWVEKAMLICVHPSTDGGDRDQFGNYVMDHDRSRLLYC